MHVVVGGWEMDPSQAGDRRATLEGIVSNVKQIPGLVKGYWTDGPTQESGPTRSSCSPGALRRRRLPPTSEATPRTRRATESAISASMSMRSWLRPSASPLSGRM